MDHHRNPHVEATGKVLRFPPRGAGHAATASDVAEVTQARGVRRREQRAAAWIGGAWVLLAWIVAVGRLRLAITGRQVFGAEASMAFLVAVLMPLMVAPRIAAAVREAVVALRRASVARRGVEPEGPEAHPPAPSRNRAGRSLQ